MGLKSILPSLSDGILNAFSAVPNEILKKINEIRIRKNLPLVLVFGKSCLFITKNGKLLNLQNDELSRPGPRLKDGAEMLYDFVYGGESDN